VDEMTHAGRGADHPPDRPGTHGLATGRLHRPGLQAGVG
jgi:hypothetical protein